MRQARWALAAWPVAALLLAGCGIRETDVIEAGGPATVEHFSRNGVDSLLFYRLPHGELTPVSRPLGTEGQFGSSYQTRPASTEKVIAALFSGPSQAEKGAGLTTSLPRITSGTVRLLPRKPGAEPGGISLSVPVAVRDLAETATQQLVCTAAYSAVGDGSVRVQLVGQDGETAFGTCRLSIPAGDE
ncbi:hypothetical protein GCM10010329_63500 [Streptomyces spiroverticillatus]|uniref:GerMN domain-containing protein n=1 Tax=Streptomyces finlayi TaxID=67296 RepID=A0A918X4M4_9ACTN|nr:hypothetical protein [Streptomyces finlayi]GHA31462.1 hypothetical protein GCM10010329_63500 [Streptomyces spiroverticillatus]GHD11096.1 hypothetical protein GCM10010334_67050 [Streptomyces finlayi]